jgi:hypothetical protein
MSTCKRCDKHMDEYEIYCGLVYDDDGQPMESPFGAGCHSCQHCGCCPCDKPGCDWCPSEINRFMMMISSAGREGDTMQSLLVRFCTEPVSGRINPLDYYECKRWLERFCDTLPPYKFNESHWSPRLQGIKSMLWQMPEPPSLRDFILDYCVERTLSEAGVNERVVDDEIIFWRTKERSGQEPE